MLKLLWTTEANEDHSEVIIQIKLTECNQQWEKTIMRSSLN